MARTDAGMAGLADDELIELMCEAVRQNARHPDFEDHSNELNYEGQVWFDFDAEAVFDCAYRELLNRHGGNISFEFSDESLLETELGKKAG